MSVWNVFSFSLSFNQVIRFNVDTFEPVYRWQPVSDDVFLDEELGTLLQDAEEGDSMDIQGPLARAYQSFRLSHFRSRSEALPEWVRDRDGASDMAELPVSMTGHSGYAREEPMIQRTYVINKVRNP